MRKLIILGFISLLVITQKGIASPTLEGRTGGFRVQSAETVKKWDISLSYFGEYFSQNNFYFGTKKDKISDDFYINFSPFDNFLLFLGKKTNAIYSQNGFDQGFSSNGLAELGFSFQKPTSSKIGFGFEVNSGFYYGSGIRTFKTTSPTFKTLFSALLSPTDSKNKLKLHHNFQYKYNQSQRATSYIATSTYNTQYLLFPKKTYHFLKTSLGLEYATSYIDFILEYSLEYLVDSRISLFKHPHYITTGFKIRPYKNSPINIHVGSDFGLNKGDYLLFGMPPAFDYNVFLGISLETNRIKESPQITQITLQEQPIIEEPPVKVIKSEPEQIEIEIDTQTDKNLLLKFRKPDESKNLLLRFRK